jgi:hypothetical protein
MHRAIYIEGEIKYLNFPQTRDRDANILELFKEAPKNASYVRA